MIISEDDDEEKDDVDEVIWEKEEVINNITH